MISSIYEQFAHTAQEDDAKTAGLHYTPVSLVGLVLDEVLSGVSPESRVLDLTCGSGVFLVESLRRLVRLKSRDHLISRTLIRETLKNQIFGVDRSLAAIRVASFSLYLTALELDPDPRPPEALRFDPLVGHNLFVADAFKVERSEDEHDPFSRPFDVIVGNPPWTYQGKGGKQSFSKRLQSLDLPPRSADFAFVWRSLDFADEHTRFGIVMRATPFFSNAAASVRARNLLLTKLAPVELISLAHLRNDLFLTALYPAVVLFARLHKEPDDDRMPIVSVPWTSAFERSGAFAVAPSDVSIASLQDITSSPFRMKAFAFGTPRDRLLLHRLRTECRPLQGVLQDCN